MKLTIKSLALAVALAASATGASAAKIDNGASGNGGLFFNIWDGATSYTLNLGLTIDSFTTQLNTTGLLDLSFAADSTLTSYLATADTSKIKWNVLATDTVGARRIIETYTTVPAVASKNDSFRTLASAIQTGLTTGSSAVNTKLANANSATFTSSEVGYFGKFAYGSTFNGLQNFSNSGTLANSTFESGLNLLIVDALSGGTAAAKYTQYLDGANKVSVYFDAANTLHISAATLPVPEPESYAMLLAGLGLLGFMARRNKRA